MKGQEYPSWMAEIPTLEFLRWKCCHLSLIITMATSHGDNIWLLYCHGDLVATFQRWSDNVGIPTLSPFVPYCRHGDISWGQHLNFFYRYGDQMATWGRHLASLKSPPCRHGDQMVTSFCSNGEHALFHIFMHLFAPKSSSSSQMTLRPHKTWNTGFDNIYGETPENQGKRKWSEGQNHNNFGSIKYPQTYLLLVLEQNKQ